MPNAYLGRDGFPPYTGGDDSYFQGWTDAQKAAVQAKEYWKSRSITVSAKLNDAWLSNKDCDPDGLLDQHYGFSSYKGSGAWETNHMMGTDEDGTHWTYFIKIVAVPVNALCFPAPAPSNSCADGSLWRLPDGTEIGPSIWSELAIIQEVYNDPAASAHGLLYASPLRPGFGYYRNPR